MNKITFNISGGKQMWEQREHDGAVRLYVLVDDWVEENEISVPAGDMVMLANLYRMIKENDIINSYINTHGTIQLTIGDDLAKALKLQIPQKPVAETDPMFGDITMVCPNCDNAGLINPINRKGFDYCPMCGQALDWSEEEWN